MVYLFFLNVLDLTANSASQSENNNHRHGPVNWTDFIQKERVIGGIYYNMHMQLVSHVYLCPVGGLRRQDQQNPHGRLLEKLIPAMTYSSPPSVDAPKAPKLYIILYIRGDSWIPPLTMSSAPFGIQLPHSKPLIGIVYTSSYLCARKWDQVCDHQNPSYCFIHHALFQTKEASEVKYTTTWIEIHI